MTGTSMAAPMVTGAAAMVWSHFDGIGAAEVKEIPFKFCDSPGQSFRKGKDRRNVKRGGGPKV